MCEGIDICPTTGLPIEQAPCHMLKGLDLGRETFTVAQQIRGFSSGILQTTGGKGEIAASFFRTGWTGNNR